MYKLFHIRIVSESEVLPAIERGGCAVAVPSDSTALFKPTYLSMYDTVEDECWVGLEADSARGSIADTIIGTFLHNVNTRNP